MTPEQKAKIPALDNLNRAARVLTSQGRPVGCVPGLSPQELEQLAAMCDPQGVLVEDIRDRFALWYEAYLEARKATEAAPKEPTVKVEE